MFFDRLIDDTDKENFVALITEKLGVLFDQTYHNICPNKQPPIFGESLSSSTRCTFYWRFCVLGLNDRGYCVLDLSVCVSV